MLKDSASRASDAVLNISPCLVTFSSRPFSNTDLMSTETFRHSAAMHRATRPHLETTGIDQVPWIGFLYLTGVHFAELMEPVSTQLRSFRRMTRTS